jgi:hypothetical protein
LFAPETDDQLKVGVVETFVAPLDGLIRVGAGSSPTAAAMLGVLMLASREKMRTRKKPRPKRNNLPTL